VWLTNVGRSHARRVRVWLEDAAGNRIGDEAVVARPLLAGGDPAEVVVRIPDPEHETKVVRVIRSYRDETGPRVDPSDQQIELL
jgi:hypothetical protein